MCVLSIKVHIRKKSGNLLYAPHISSLKKKKFQEAFSPGQYLLCRVQFIAWCWRHLKRGMLRGSSIFWWPLIKHVYLIYMYKEDFGLNNLQWLVCHKTQLNQIIYICYIYIYIFLDTHQVITSESMVWVLSDLAWSSKILQTKWQDVFHHLVTVKNCVFTFYTINVFWLLLWQYSQVWTRKV